MSPTPQGPSLDDLELRAAKAEGLVDRILAKMNPDAVGGQGDLGKALEGLVKTLEYTRHQISLHQASMA